MQLGPVEVATIGLVVVIVKGSALLLLAGSVVYFVRRNSRRAAGIASDETAERLLRLEAESADLREQLAEVHERLDFTERLLVARNDPHPVAQPEPKHLTPV